MTDPDLQSKQRGVQLCVLNYAQLRNIIWATERLNNSKLKISFYIKSNLHVFCGSDKAYDHLPLGVLCQGAAEVSGPRFCCCKTFGPCRKSWVHILGTKLYSFPVPAGLRQSCSLSPIPFVIFMNRISGQSQAEERLFFFLVWEHLRILQEEVVNVALERTI